MGMWADDAASAMLGMQAVEVAPGRARVSMLVRPDMVNGHRLCHGGVIASLADSAFALACNSHGPVTVAAGFSIDFLQPGRLGQVLPERPQVEPAIADERLQRLQGLITGQQREIQNSMVGRDVSVLVEKTGREAGQMVGKSEYLHSVHIDEAQAEVGDVVRVRIVDAKTNSLTARQI